MSKSVNYKEKMSEIWKENMFYIRLENLNRFGGWVSDQVFNQGSKLVVQFYELGENRETILLEKKEYRGKSKNMAYLKFIGEFSNTTPMIEILHKFTEKSQEYYRYRVLNKYNSSGSFHANLFKIYSEKFIMINQSGNYYNTINQMTHENKQ